MGRDLVPGVADKEEGERDEKGQAANTGSGLEGREVVEQRRE